MTRPRAGTLLWRALFKRCPRCGQKKIFESFFTLPRACPNCGYVFERQEGYWVGAMIVNIAVAEAWFFILFIGVLIATMPDIAWQPLLLVALVTNGLLPIVFYPHSKTFWMAIDLYVHPPKEGDPDDPAVRAGAR
jgi:uncharacterized protein (DUF983 family)